MIHYSFHPEIYAVLICVHEIQMIARSEKYVSICSDSPVALIALQAAKTTSRLVQQCQKALNDISTWYSTGLFWVPEHSGVCGTEISDEPAREGTSRQFVGPELPLGVSRQNIGEKIKYWMDNKHKAMWWGLTSTQREAQKLILGPSVTAKTKLLSFNRTQSRVVTGLHTRHNTLRRHLYLMGLISSPLCSRCAAEEETSAHILCEYEALASLRHAYLNLRCSIPKCLWNKRWEKFRQTQQW